MERAPSIPGLPMGALQNLPRFNPFQYASGDGIADLEILTESKSFSVTALGQKGSDVFTIPQGYSRIFEIMFDPTVTAIFNLKSQRAKQDILNGFSTKNSPYGWLRLYTKMAEQDVLNFQYEFINLGNIVNGWVDAAGVDTVSYQNQLPYTLTVTLLYAR